MHTSVDPSVPGRGSGSAGRSTDVVELRVTRPRDGYRGLLPGPDRPVRWGPGSARSGSSPTRGRPSLARRRAAPRGWLMAQRGYPVSGGPATLPLRDPCARVPTADAPEPPSLSERWCPVGRQGDGGRAPPPIAGHNSARPSIPANSTKPGGDQVPPCGPAWRLSTLPGALEQERRLVRAPSCLPGILRPLRPGTRVDRRCSVCQTVGPSVPAAQAEHRRGSTAPAHRHLRRDQPARAGLDSGFVTDPLPAEAGGRSADR